MNAHTQEVCSTDIYTILYGITCTFVYMYIYYCNMDVSVLVLSLLSSTGLKVLDQQVI